MSVGLVPGMSVMWTSAGWGYDPPRDAVVRIRRNERGHILTVEPGRTRSFEFEPPQFMPPRIILGGTADGRWYECWDRVRVLNQARGAGGRGHGIEFVRVHSARELTAAGAALLCFLYDMSVPPAALAQAREDPGHRIAYLGDPDMPGIGPDAEASEEIVLMDPDHPSLPPAPRFRLYHAAPGSWVLQQTSHSPIPAADAYHGPIAFWERLNGRTTRELARDEPEIFTEYRESTSYGEVDAAIARFLCEHAGITLPEELAPPPNPGPQAVPSAEDVIRKFPDLRPALQVLIRGFDRYGDDWVSKQMIALDLDLTNNSYLGKKLSELTDKDILKSSGRGYKRGPGWLSERG